MGKVATTPPPSRESPPLQSKGKNQKWPSSGQSGYDTPAVSGIPTASERGAKSEVAHLRAKWLRHPRRLGDPHRFRAREKIRRGPQVGKVATSRLPSRGSPPLKSGGQNQKWPSSGQSGYVTPAVSGIHTTSERGAKSEVAHLWAKWLCHPRRLGDPHRFRAGGKIRSGPQLGKLATSPLPSRGSPPLQRGAKSEVAHLWAKWLRHPRRLGDPHRFGARGKIRSGPQVAKWLRHPCRLGDPHRFEAGGKIRSGPQGGKMATSPLPSRGSPGGKIRSGPQVGKMATSPLPSRGSPPL